MNGVSDRVDVEEIAGPWPNGFGTIWISLGPSSAADRSDVAAGAC